MDDGDEAVKRLLVTGDDTQLMNFHMLVAVHLNGLERRGQTVIYTAFREHVEGALSIAVGLGLTVEEVVGAGGGESYRVLCGDARQGWGAKTGRVAAQE